jgi:NAD(P)H dehydrogenase (quinone)
LNPPRILVMGAAGKTGAPVAFSLLEAGFPITALVRREDARSMRLREKGADILVGSMTDVADMRKALNGAARAYFCTPALEGNLTATATFCAVAAETRLETVVAMGQWLSCPSHPALHTRETWLADRLLAQIPGVALTILNPGFFADNDMQVLSMAAQFGVMMLPYGQGQNAPPSNEDMGRVAAAILARPEGHAGQTYRITGPKLLSPPEIAATVGRVLGRKVRYVDAPLGIFKRVMKQMGMSDYIIAQFVKYAAEYRRGTFAVGGPTDVVRRITGREAEDYETIVRRYAASMPDVRRSLGTAVRLIVMSNAAMLRRPDIVRPLRLDQFSDPNHAVLCADSAEWQDTHDLQDNVLTANPASISKGADVGRPSLRSA